MSETLKNLWNQLVEVGYQVRSNDLDGLAAWQP